MSDNIFYRFAPFIQDYIYRNKWEELRDIQVAAADIIFNTDDNLLLTSGTASGKTEAAFLPVLTQLWENPSGSVGVLYISPLKALINDQFERLTGLLEEADIPVTKWHGDASPTQKKKLVKNPCGIMQTTPESLESLLIRNSSNAYRLFSDLRFIVIDEVHYFMDSDRGLQLLSVLERLQRIIGFIPRRIGLSATLGEDSAHAPEYWLSMGTNSACVTPKSREAGRKIRISVKYFPISEKIPNTNSKVLLENYYQYLYESTYNKRCILFSNSKGEVEENIAHLKRLSAKNHTADTYLVHHANISSALREHAETQMKTAELPLCVGATVTLELGIDLGNLERIVQTGCPLTVSGFVQRLGRTGRRRNSVGEMRFAFRWDTSLPPAEFYKSINWDFVMCIAMILLYTREKWVEPVRLPKMPFSLLFHQTMSVMTANGSLMPKELAKQILSLSVFSHIGKEDYLLLLRHLLENGCLERGENGELMIGEKGEGVVNNYEFLAVFSVPMEYTVRCGGSGDNTSAEIIGTVQNPFPPKAQFALAGQAWEVIELDKKELNIYVRKIEGISANMWMDTGNEYVHTRVMKKMLEVLENAEEYGFLDVSAAVRLAEIRSAWRNAAGERKGSHVIVPLSETVFAVFPFIGTRGTAALVYALRQHGLGAELWLSRYIPVCIRVETDKGMDYVADVLDEIKSSGADKYSFKVAEDSEISGKFNDYIPRQLLVKQYTEDYLDTEDLKNLE